MKIIAEIGVCHNSSYGVARQLVQQSIEAGADIIKFQWYHQSTFPKLPSLQMSNYNDLIKTIRDSGRHWFATCFDEWAMRRATDLGQKTWKVPSGLLENAAYFVKLLDFAELTYGDVWLSTGLSTREIVILQYLRAKRRRIAGVKVFHCISEYPTKLKHMNLKSIVGFQETFNGNTSLSDHSTGSNAIMSAIIAQALNCQYLEKHVTLSKNMPGPDHRSSLTIKELKYLIDVVRSANEMLGVFNFKYGELPEWLKEKREAIEEAMQPVTEGLTSS